ncbi:hypothetical protein QFZ52_000623 [Arthrobacter woluwensis]|nr:hypothetical protein [Arthrobacter woluwensis]
MAGKVQNVPGSGHSSRVKERRAAGPLSGKGLRSAVRTFLLIVPPVFAAGVFAVGVWYIIAVGPATAMLRAIGVSYAENPLGTVATFGLVVILLLVICGLIWRTKTVMGRRRPVVVSDSPFRGVGPWGTRAYVTGASSPMPREMAAVSKVYGATVAQVVVARSLPGDGRKDGDGAGCGYRTPPL